MPSQISRTSPTRGDSISNGSRAVRTGKEIRFRFGSSEDKAGKEAKRRPTGW